MKKARHNPDFIQAHDEADAERRALCAKALGQAELDSKLDTAVRFRDALLTRALLKAGANPNSRDGNSQTVLGHAVGRLNLQLLELLLEYGADPNLPTILNTPLLDAIYEEQWPIISRLLDAGADVNKTGFVTATALHVAVNPKRDAKLVKLLLARGAKVNAKDDEGLTPLDWAERNGDKAIIHLLKAVGAKSCDGAKAAKPSGRKPARAKLPISRR